jgi:uncharacterized protein YkwD
MRPRLRPASALLGAGLTVLGLMVLSVSAVGARAVAVSAPQASQADVFLPLIVQAPTPTPTPTPTPPPVTPPASGDWHAFLDYYRASARLPALVDNTGWGKGAALHARYMVENAVLDDSEELANPWYSTEGAAAAPNSNLMLTGNVATTDQQALDFWMGKPFHALGLLSPALLSTGFGSFRDNNALSFKMGAAIDVRRGLGAIPGGVQFPIKWPDHNTTVYLTSYDGNEQPDPLSSCSGFNPPSGLPIILQLGPGNVTPDVTAHSFRQGNTSLTHCVFDETDYGNSIPSLQALGRSLLDASDAVVLIPQQPLVPGNSYTVSITSNGAMTSWTFRVAP